VQLGALRPDGRPTAASRNSSGWAPSGSRFAADVEAEEAALIEQAAKGLKAQTISCGSPHCGSGDDGDDTRSSDGTGSGARSASGSPAAAPADLHFVTITFACING